MPIAESERVTSLLKNAIRLSNSTYRDVERQLGWRIGTITRLLRGGLGLKIEHLLSILSVIKLSPARFFAAAYPDAVAAHPAEVRLFRMLEQLHGEEGQAAEQAALLSQTSPASPVGTGWPGHTAAQQEDIDEMVRTSLRKLIGVPNADSATGKPSS